MQYLGEVISLVVACSWTVTALFAEIGSKRLGSLQMNVIRMLLSLLMLGATLWWFTGSPFPLYADGKAWFWLSLSGFVGYLLGDYCLFNSYIWIGSRVGQLFMTLAPPTAALT
jgi:drug/metabolite transporter (DMT)-like permease